MRNFEADKMVRLGDVIDVLNQLRDVEDHEVDLGEFGFHYMTCENAGFRNWVTQEVTKLAR